MTKRLRRLASLASVFLAGCATGATLQNTPAQDYVWELSRKCNAAGITMTRVDPDGRYWARGENATSFDSFTSCMQEQQRKYPYQTWLAASGRSSSTPTPSVGQAISAVATPSAAPSTTSTPTGTPVWTRGEEWQYRMKSPQFSGTFVLIVDREEVVDGVPCYVLKVGSTMEGYYRKSDLAYYMETVQGRVHSKHVPPTPYAQWPLVPGSSWDLAFAVESPQERQTYELSLRCESGAVESITVPAGTFETIPVTCRDTRTDLIAIESWPSLAVKQVVKHRVHVFNGIEERELIGVKLGR